MIKYVFYVKPIGKPRMTRKDKWSKRKCVVEYWQYKDQIKLQAKERGFALKNGSSYYFYIAMPASWSKKKRKEKLGKLHDQKPDLDNILKGFWDACTDDDSFLGHIKESKKIWSEFNYIEVVDCGK